MNLMSQSIYYFSKLMKFQQKKLIIKKLKIKKKEEKKVGRKRKGQEAGVHHSKFSDDNLRRKIKHIVLSDLQFFINKKIKEIYHNNIGQGMTIKQILTLNHEQKKILMYNIIKIFWLKP